ncbi:hypothetical protein ACOI1A_00760 [Corynebacterium glutamicum]|uniref:hypothetical protein n=1 Tax=Corynebacterium glutamicum TaxID=1718 RepID=UPI003B5C03FF
MNSSIKAVLSLLRILGEAAERDQAVAEAAGNDDGVTRAEARQEAIDEIRTLIENLAD